MSNTPDSLDLGHWCRYGNYIVSRYTPTARKLIEWINAEAENLYYGIQSSSEFLFYKILIEYFYQSIF